MAATISRIRSRSMGRLLPKGVDTSRTSSRMSVDPPELRRLVTENVQLGERLLVKREADRRADRGDDPEAQDDLRLRPRLELEVMVDRGHLEDALAEGLKGEDLDQDRERLDHEDPA